MVLFNAALLNVRPANAEGRPRQRRQSVRRSWEAGVRRIFGSPRVNVLGEWNLNYELYCCIVAVK